MISRPRASTRSTVSCGRAVCPPGPVSVTSTRSQAAVIAPVRSPTVPDRDGRVAVQGERARGALQHAGGDHLAWRRRARPPRPAGRRSARCPAAPSSAASASATPSTTVGVHVVPAGVADALAGGGVGDVLEVGQRQGVDVGPEDDDRAAAAADLATRPVPAGQPPRRQARASRSRRSRNAVVSNSAKASSGWACRCRRIATSCVVVSAPRRRPSGPSVAAGLRHAWQHDPARRRAGARQPVPQLAEQAVDDRPAGRRRAAAATARWRW